MGEKMTSWPETRNSLIQRLADPNDARSWEEFERCYQPAIYRYGRGRGLQPSDALDAVQEVMLAVHKQAAHWQPSGRTGSFRAWLAETARRVTLQQLRLRDRGGTGGSSFVQTLQELAVASSDSGQTADERRWQFYCAAAAVETRVNKLHWQAFWMTAVEGLRPEVVATQLEMKLGTVYSVRCRIQAKIRAELLTMSDAGRGDS